MWPVATNPILLESDDPQPLTLKYISYTSDTGPVMCDSQPLGEPYEYEGDSWVLCSHAGANDTTEALLYGFYLITATIHCHSPGDMLPPSHPVSQWSIACRVNATTGEGNAVTTATAFNATLVEVMLPSWNGACTLPLVLNETAMEWDIATACSKARLSNDRWGPVLSVANEPRTIGLIQTQAQQDGAPLEQWFQVTNDLENLPWSIANEVQFTMEVHFGGGQYWQKLEVLDMDEDVMVLAVELPPYSEVCAAQATLSNNCTKGFYLALEVSQRATYADRVVVRHHRCRAIAADTCSYVLVYYFPPCQGAAWSPACLSRPPSAANCPVGEGASCSPCPTGAICPGGNRVWPQPGYWTPSETYGSVFQCSPPSTQRCQGWSRRYNATDCGPNFDRSSYSCVECIPGFYFEDGACYPCSDVRTFDFSGKWLPMVVTVGILLLIFLVQTAAFRRMFRYLDLPSSWMQSARVSWEVVLYALVTLQVIGQVSRAWSPGLPRVQRQIFALFQFIQLDFSTVTPKECRTGYHFTSEVGMFSVLLFLLALVALYSINCCRIRMYRCACTAVQDWVRYFALVALFLAYPTCISMAVDTVQCKTIVVREMNTDAVVEAFVFSGKESIGCLSSEHLFPAALAMTVIVTLGAGLPLYLFVVIGRQLQGLSTIAPEKFKAAKQHSANAMPAKLPRTCLPCHRYPEPVFETLQLDRSWIPLYSTGQPWVRPSHLYTLLVLALVDLMAPRPDLAWQLSRAVTTAVTCCLFASLVTFRTADQAWEMWKRWPRFLVFLTAALAAVMQLSLALDSHGNSDSEVIAEPSLVSTGLMWVVFALALSLPVVLLGAVWIWIFSRMGCHNCARCLRGQLPLASSAAMKRTSHSATDALRALGFTGTPTPQYEQSEQGEAAAGAASPSETLSKKKQQGAPTTTSTRNPGWPLYSLDQDWADVDGPQHLEALNHASDSKSVPLSNSSDGMPMSQRRSTVVMPNPLFRGGATAIATATASSEDRHPQQQQQEASSAKATPLALAFTEETQSKTARRRPFPPRHSIAHLPSNLQQLRDRLASMQAASGAKPEHLDAAPFNSNHSSSSLRRFSAVNGRLGSIAPARRNSQRRRRFSSRRYSFAPGKGSNGRRRSSIARRRPTLNAALGTAATGYLNPMHGIRATATTPAATAAPPEPQTAAWDLSEQQPPGTATETGTQGDVNQAWEYHDGDGAGGQGQWLYDNEGSEAQLYGEADYDGNDDCFLTENPMAVSGSNGSGRAGNASSAHSNTASTPASGASNAVYDSNGNELHPATMTPAQRRLWLAGEYTTRITHRRRRRSSLLREMLGRRKVGNYVKQYAKAAAELHSTVEIVKDRRKRK